MNKNESQNTWNGKYQIDDTMFDKYSYIEIRKSINKGETKLYEVKIVLEKIIRDLQNILDTLPVKFFNPKITDFENKFLQINVYDSSQNDETNINYYIGVYKDKISHIHEFIDDKDSVIFHYFDCNMRPMLDSEKCKQDGYLKYLFNYWQALKVRIEQKILPNFEGVLGDLNKDEISARLKLEQGGDQSELEQNGGNDKHFTTNQIIVLKKVAKVNMGTLSQFAEKERKPETLTIECYNMKELKIYDGAKKFEIQVTDLFDNLNSNTSRLFFTLLFSHINKKDADDIERKKITPIKSDSGKNRTAITRLNSHLKLKLNLNYNPIKSQNGQYHLLFNKVYTAKITQGGEYNDNWVKHKKDSFNVDDFDHPGNTGNDVT